ncbi:hypothetical protein [Macrococcus bovicus]|uniref:Uncharacterized protein n=1 Tax=Macrococcus bovicus TaxID=69968 RepID=A0A4R6C1C1_9STAP|nr:hypothetical protein [Macrococcus bovicus]TDM14930.1 hypothetical protein ERX55_03045 [Macrococcus bovicus]
MYLLELHQDMQICTVGLFDSENSVKNWLKSIDYITVDLEKFEDTTYEEYYMEYHSLPVYEEIEWMNSKFILSKYMFSPNEGKIIALWKQIPILSHINGLVNGQMKVSAYVLDNEDAKSYILAYEEMKDYISRYFEKDHIKVEFSGQGSEDGEYLLLDGHFICHLEGSLIDKWRMRRTDELFIEENIG